MTQKRALQQDHFLFGLYKQNASQFVQQKGIENITQDYLAELITATTFLPLEKQSAFTFLQFCLPIIVPTHTFTFLWKKLLQGFEHKILLDTVTQIRKTKANYVVQTTQGKCLSSTYLVIATPPLIAQQLLHLKKIKKPTLVHMYHLKGELKEKGKRWQEYFFLPTNDIFVIARQPDKSYLLYSRKEKPPFQHYFQKYKVINHHFWNPAFHLQGDILLDQKYKPHLYVAGDHNLCGMEDAFISGVFAARQILKEQEKI